MKHLFYHKLQPIDLVSTFQNNDQEMVKHIIGEKAYNIAKARSCSFHFLVGRYDFNTQMVHVGIQIHGEPKDITFWLLNYT